MIPDIFPNPHVGIRPWKSTDASDLLAAFSGAGMESQRPPDLLDLASAEEQIQTWIAATSSGSSLSFAVVVDDRAVGNVSASSINGRHGTAWVSYWTIESKRGRGYATAGLSALSAYCFSELGLFRLELGHRVNNPASCAVANRAGYSIEGVERAKLEYDGIRYDVELHAKLRTDQDH